MPYPCFTPVGGEQALEKSEHSQLTSFCCSDVLSHVKNSVFTEVLLTPMGLRSLSPPDPKYTVHEFVISHTLPLT